MAATASRRSEQKGSPLYLPGDITRQLADRLHDTREGHFPVVTGSGATVAVVVSVDRFNVLVHLAELLDDPKVAAAIADARAKDEKERYLSFEEVFSR